MFPLYLGGGEVTPQVFCVTGHSLVPPLRGNGGHFL